MLMKFSQTGGSFDISSIVIGLPSDSRYLILVHVHTIIGLVAKRVSHKFMKTVVSCLTRMHDLKARIKSRSSN